jgi:hypothetical protein
MTCLIVWLLQSHRQKIDFTSKILRRWRKLAKSIFSMRIWVVKNFRFFSIDHVIWDVFCRRNRSESKSKRARRTHIQFISSFSDSCESDSFFSFFDCWSESHRDRVALNSLKMRNELLSKMFACRSIVVWFTHVSARSRWVYAFEIFQSRCSTCSLLICILYEWCSTYLRFACNIWFESAIDSNADRWKRRASQFSKSKSKWLETTRKCFVNNYFIWLRIYWSFSIFYSRTCVKRKHRKWESNEQRKCTTFVFCERSLLRWKSTISWKSWSVSSFFLEFSYVWISFQSCVDLHVENSNVDSRLNRVRVNLDRDRHVKLLRISDEMNQFVFD